MTTPAVRQGGLGRPGAGGKTRLAEDITALDVAITEFVFDVVMV